MNREMHTQHEVTWSMIVYCVALQAMSTNNRKVGYIGVTYAKVHKQGKPSSRLTATQLLHKNVDVIWGHLHLPLRPQIRRVWAVSATNNSKCTALNVCEINNT